MESTMNENISSLGQKCESASVNQFSVFLKILKLVKFARRFDGKLAIEYYKHSGFYIRYCGYVEFFSRTLQSTNVYSIDENEMNFQSRYLPLLVTHEWIYINTMR